jgi:hypothetical protein
VGFEKTRTGGSLTPTKIENSCKDRTGGSLIPTRFFHNNSLNWRLLKRNSNNRPTLDQQFSRGGGLCNCNPSRKCNFSAGVFSLIYMIIGYKKISALFKMAKL